MIKSVCAIIFSQRKKCITSNVLNLPVPFLYSDPNLYVYFSTFQNSDTIVEAALFSLLKNMLEFSIIVV